MTERQLFEAIGFVDDDLILSADMPAKKRRKPPVYLWPAVSAAACAALLTVGVVGWRSGNTDRTALTTAMDAMEESAPAEAPLYESAPEAAADNAFGAVQNDAAGTAQCVQLNGALYYDTWTESDDQTSPADGTISAEVDSDALPNTDECSNFGTGYAYRLHGDTADLLIDGVWYVFAKS